MIRLTFTVCCLLASLLAAAPLHAQEPEGPIPPPIEDPAEAARAATEQAEREAVLVLRLSDDLEPEARAAVRAVIDTLPGVVIGRRATHEIGPRPSLSEIVALYEIPGAIPRAAFSAANATLALSSPEELFAFYSGEFESDNDWAWRIPRPVELGDPGGDGFADRLRAALRPLVRRAALEEFALGNGYGKIALCLANERPRAGFCPLPRAGRSWNEVDVREPIYLSAEASLGEARHFAVVAMDRNGALTPLGAGEAVQYITDPGAGPDGEPSREIPEIKFVFSPADPLNDKLVPGHYDLFVIAAAEPVPDELWARAAEPAAQPEDCPQTRWAGLCRALLGGRGVMPYDIEADIARIEVAVVTEPKQTQRVVRGENATRGVSLWQAQLFRFRPEDAGRGAGLFDFRKAHRCGGVYLGDGFVLTAAHCIPREVSEVRVRLGTSDLRSGGRSFKVRSLVLHGLGDSSESRVDLALIQLAASRASLDALGEDLASIDPASDPDKDFAPIDGLIATGWGFVKERLPGETGWKAADGTRNTKADRLQQVRLAEAPMTECTARAEYGAYREEDMLCLRGAMERSDTCAGDSGGPVTSRARGGRELVGIVSTGVGCAYQNVPAVYVNVARHRDWIERARKKMLSSRPGYYELD